MQIFEVIQKHFEALCHRYAPIHRALKRAKPTGSRTIPHHTAHADPIRGVRGRAIEHDRVNHNAAKHR